MHVEETKARNFLKALGSPCGSAREMQLKLNTFASWSQSVTLPDDPQVSELARDLREALAENEGVIVVPDLPGPTERLPETSEETEQMATKTKPKKEAPKKTPAKNEPKAKPKTKPKGKKSEEAEPRSPLTAGDLKQSGFWRQGVLEYIIAALLKAKKTGKPITRRELHEQLVEEFPDRDPGGMWTTLSQTVPGRLIKNKGYDVRGDMRSGFWIEGQL